MHCCLRITQFINWFLVLAWIALGLHTIILSIEYEINNEYFDLDEVKDLGNFVIIGLNYYIDDEDDANKAALGIGIAMIASGLIGFLSICMRNKCLQVTYLGTLIIFFLAFMGTQIYGLVDEKGDDEEDATGWAYSMFTLVHIMFSSCMYYYQGEKVREKQYKQENNYERKDYAY